MVYLDSHRSRPYRAELATTNGLGWGGSVLFFALLSFVIAIIVGYAVYVDARRRDDPNAVLLGLFIGFFTLLGIVPGFLALLLYLYGRGID